MTVKKAVFPAAGLGTRFLPALNSSRILRLSSFSISNRWAGSTFT